MRVAVSATTGTCSLGLLSFFREILIDLKQLFSKECFSWSQQTRATDVAAWLERPQSASLRSADMRGASETVAFGAARAGLLCAALLLLFAGAPGRQTFAPAAPWSHGIVVQGRAVDT